MLVFYFVFLTVKVEYIIGTPISDLGVALGNSLKNGYYKPKKCGIMGGFISKCLTNEDNKTYYMGHVILNLWQRCDGNRTLDDLVKLMSEDNTKTECTPTVIKEMLDLLETRKLITYHKLLVSD